MDFRFPKQLGIWRLGSPLHRGPAFSVATAQPTDAIGSPRWDYAIKFGSGPESRDGIARTIAASAATAHPNLVPVIDAQCGDGDCFVVMPRLQGTSMARRLASRSDHPVPVALWMVRQLAQALQAMHEAGWVHGHVDLDHAIVGDNGHVTLIDLVWARPFRSEIEARDQRLPAEDTARPMADDVLALGQTLWQWLARVNTSDEQILGPACLWVERMIDDRPDRRPSADEVAAALLQMEIDTLGEHIAARPNRRVA